ncbi:hypothetical protein ACP4OV_013584 [Aristida adscensionis]
MRTEVIKADQIDEAAIRILEELKDDVGTASSSSRHNVIYFDGWEGLGASAVLQDVRRRLTGSEEFKQIIHIDCSKWESRRATQRALAEKLGLPPLVIQMFDTQDEEDDYKGVPKSSRDEIPEVARKIYQHIQRQMQHRFLVIFHNGSSKEIDLDSLGFPLAGYSRNKALWSFQGRFRLHPRMKVDEALMSTRTTDVLLSAASHDGTTHYSYLVKEEASELAQRVSVGVSGIDGPASAVNCFLYMMKLCRMGNDLINYLDTHCCNYWKCDGIIRLQHGTDVDDDRVWLYCDALRREMRMDADYYQNPYLPYQW